MTYLFEIPRTSRLGSMIPQNQIEKIWKSMFEKRGFAMIFKMSNRPSRRAFTLIELIVVLTILVGLAGVLIPTITNMVGRTNRSTSASNIAEIAGAVQRYEAIFFNYPDRLDAMKTDLVGTDLNTLNPDLPLVTENVTLTADTLATLNEAGLVNVGIHTADDTTFVLPTPTAMAVGTVLLGLTAAHQVDLGLETTGSAGKYVVFGIGTLSALTGTVMVDAPVHFPRDADTNPDEVYSRFLAIFQITDGTDALVRARFIGVIAPDGAGLSTQLGGYYNISANE
jgi:prepilin-type N-terminal cleavage/methylation domain-containing protein